MLATQLLRQQHRRIESLLDCLAADATPQRVALVLQLVEELFTHLSIEDHLFFAAVADATGIAVDPYHESQSQVRNAMLQAVFAESDPAQFPARRDELAAAFAAHARAVERDLLPAVEQSMPLAQLERIGTRMLAFWDAAMGRAERERPADGRRRHVDAAE